MELVLYARIKDVGGFIDVKDVVALPYAGGSHIIVVQMSPRKAGEVRSTLMALLSSPYLHPKIGIAVDDDIDPHNAQSVMSTSFRVCGSLMISAIRKAPPCVDIAQGWQRRQAGDREKQQRKA